MQVLQRGNGWVQKYGDKIYFRFDGESYTEKVEARTADEAQNICERLQFEVRLCRNLITTQPLFTCILYLTIYSIILLPFSIIPH